MDKIFLFQAFDELGNDFYSIAFQKFPSQEDYLFVFKENKDAGRALEELIQNKGRGIIENNSVSYSLTQVLLRKNSQEQKALLHAKESDDVQLIGHYSCLFVDGVVLPNDKIEGFLALLQDRYGCRVIFDEQGISSKQIYRLNADDFLHFFEKHKENMQDHFSEKELGLIEAIYNLIVFVQPEYIRDTGYVMFQ